MVKNSKNLPSLADLEQIREKVKNVPNKRGEYLRGIHAGCYLLCSQSGLRISEAVGFNLNAKTSKGLYRIEKPKGKKERFVYISKEVIQELKKNNWKPHQTNRFAFYHFLGKIKRGLKISPQIELSPHTLRRAFATYHAENGLPLPLLSKLLGHSSIRTTALYWKNIYGKDDTEDILAGKKWLERSPEPFGKGLEEPKEPPKLPDEIASLSGKIFSGQLSENFKPVISTNKTVQQYSPLLIKTEPKPTINNYQPQPLTGKIPPKSQRGNFPNVIIKENQPSENEKFLLAKIKQLETELAQVQAENNNLKLENKHLKSLISQEQLTEAQVIQPLPFKPNK